MKSENDFPKELLQEIEAYSKVEGITIKEFILWAVGEKIGELREMRGLKNLTQIVPNPISEKQVIEESKPKTATPKPLLKAIDISRILKISKSAVYQLMKNGDIPVVKFGKIVRVREEDLDRFILRSKM
jgi:excisionase family DNA binding protein